MSWPRSRAPAGMRLNDTDPTITYSGFSDSANRGLGDFDNDVHFATANGSTAKLTFTGTGIQVFGEQNTDQGNIGISIDGGAEQTISTLPSDGQRHSNVAVYTAAGLASGNHTIVVTKLSGTYTTLDGFNITSS
jgi:Carbohydrate esterase 2 N-terminal